MKSSVPDFARTLDWNLLKVFREIVRAGGVTRASHALVRKQPALSLALKRLESQCGVVLCRRGPGGFELTDEGRIVAAACEHVLTQIGQLPNSLAGPTQEVRGRVRIQLISSIVNTHLDDAIAEFHRRYPWIEIVIDVATWGDVVNALMRNEIDIGLAPARFHRAELRYDLLFHEIHRPYCGRSHPLFGRRIRDPHRLAAEAFVLTGADEPDELTRYRLRYGLGRVVAGLSEHLEEAKRLAVLGVGLCFLPEGFAEPDVQAGRLWPVLGKSQQPQMAIFVITNPNAPRHLAGQLFLDELSRRLAAARTTARKPRQGRRSVVA